MDLRADGELAIFFGSDVLRGGSYELAEGRIIYSVEDLPLELRRLLEGRAKPLRRESVEIPEGFSEFVGAEELLAEAIAGMSTQDIAALSTTQGNAFTLAQQAAFSADQLNAMLLLLV